MPHHHTANSVCAACEATGLPYVKARDLKPGMLIQDRFKPGPYTEYQVGEVGDVEIDPLEGEDGEEPSVFVRWNFAWHRRYRGDQLLAEETGDWRVTHVAIGHSEYLPLEPGSVQRPADPPPAEAP
ncbi:hypothetical protein ACIQU4_28665 [Streptomyces sp. NPDC090741]|uniref:hypothetical protein n=1 Tax=Streptomyces sp. NPDC090741 TaxID=3365967 RepID=UPI0037F7DD8C